MKKTIDATVFVVFFSFILFGFIGVEFFLLFHFLKNRKRSPDCSEKKTILL